MIDHDKIGTAILLAASGGLILLATIMITEIHKLSDAIISLAERLIELENIRDEGEE